MNYSKVVEHITAWLSNYCDKAGLSGFIIGISGGVDSGLTSTLCAMSGKKTILLSMPIHQPNAEYQRARNHMKDLEARFENVTSMDIDLTLSFDQISADFPDDVAEHHLAMANTRARLRMSTLYAIGQVNGCLVCGTGNKVEDFGVGFYTKYGDGGVDISPIADLTKSEVWALASEVDVIEEIVTASPTDGLWDDGRTDEDQIGASYPELEWAMEYKGDGSLLSERKQEVLSIYQRLNRMNRHKMEPIPVCIIPQEL
ncbi:MAG: NAD(+) synthase [Crocinitomicaceae bacterium]|nr:NAD(+) synthase [Crocinitomicaceae bacterium]MDG1658645.1 NAD(+) synthase [Crocinitomicaceae bacterium]